MDGLTELTVRTVTYHMQKPTSLEIIQNVPYAHRAALHGLRKIQRGGSASVLSPYAKPPSSFPKTKRTRRKNLALVRVFYVGFRTWDYTVITARTLVP